MRDDPQNAPLRYRNIVIWGIISLFLAGIPLIGAAWTIVSMPILFFVIPLFASGCGIAAVWNYLRYQKRIKRLEETPAPTQARPRSTTMPLLGLVFGLVGMTAGLFYAAAFVYFAQASKSEPRPLPGESKLFYYGSPEFDEASLNTVLESDSTLLTLGWRRVRKESETGYNAVLIHSTLQGQELNQIVIDNASWGRMTRAGNAVIGFLKPQSSPPQGLDSVLVMHKYAGSDNLNWRRYAVGKITGFSHAVPTAEGGAAVLGYMLPAPTSERTLFLFIVNGAGDSLKLTLYPNCYFGALADFIELKSGGFAGVGYTVFQNESQSGGLLQLFRLDADGELLWSIGDEDSIQVEGISAAEADDSSLIVLGMTPQREDGSNLEWLRFSGTGQLINRRQLGNEFVTATQLLRIDDSRWMALGYVSRSRSLWQWGRLDQSSYWDTWHISILDNEGELLTVYDGGRDRISAWRGLKIATGRFVITGFGSPIEVKGRERVDDDIAIVLMKFND